jgi:hypothetical protein
MIMDLYNKAAAIDWMILDQRADMEAAIQYNLANPDAPHDYLWGGKKLKKVASAVKEMEKFLGSEEASDFVKEREAAGKSMECDDLEFWEDNLWEPSDWSLGIQQPPDRTQSPEISEPLSDHQAAGGTDQE